MAGIATTATTFTKAGNGGFWHSCLMHVGMQGAPYLQYQVNGVTMQQAFSKWWNAPVTDAAREHTYTQDAYLQDASPHQVSHATCRSIAGVASRALNTPVGCCVPQTNPSCASPHA